MDKSVLDFVILTFLFGLPLKKLRTDICNSKNDTNEREKGSTYGRRLSFSSPPLKREGGKERRRRRSGWEGCVWRRKRKLRQNDLIYKFKNGYLTYDSSVYPSPLNLSYFEMGDLLPPTTRPSVIITLWTHYLNWISQSRGCLVGEFT